MEVTIGRKQGGQRWCMKHGAPSATSMVEPCFSLRTPASFAQLMRPVAIAGASGGVVSAVLALVRDSLSADFVGPYNCPTVRDLFGSQFTWSLDYPSLVLGILLGLLLGQLLEALIILRQLWALHFRARLGLQGAARARYRVLE